MRLWTEAENELVREEIANRGDNSSISDLARKLAMKLDRTVPSCRHKIERFINEAGGDKLEHREFYEQYREDIESALSKIAGGESINSAAKAFTKGKLINHRTVRCILGDIVKRRGIQIKDRYSSTKLREELARDIMKQKLSPAQASEIVSEVEGCTKHTAKKSLRTLTLKASAGKSKDNILSIVRRFQQGVTLGELSRSLDRSKETILAGIKELQEDGSPIEYDELQHKVYLVRTPKSKPEYIKIPHLRKEGIRIGLVSDTHFCSKFMQLTLLHSAYKCFAENEVDFIIHGGDLLDGPPSKEGKIYEQFLHGYHEQIEFAEKYYPVCNKNDTRYNKDKNSYTAKTWMIEGGCHDLWWINKAGISPVRDLVKRRDDIILLEGPFANFEARGFRFFVVHPTGGGSYARSYQIQKGMERYLDEMLSLRKFNEIPDFAFFGHYHNDVAFRHGCTKVMGLFCFQLKYNYLKKKLLFPKVGFYILDIVKSNGIWKLNPVEYYLGGKVIEDDWKNYII